MPIACRGIQNHAAALYASRHLVRADDFAEVKRCRCVLNREAGDRNVEDPTNLADTLTRQDFAAAVKDFGEPGVSRSEEHTSELQSLTNLVCRLLLEKKNVMPQNFGKRALK